MTAGTLAYVLVLQSEMRKKRYLDTEEGELQCRKAKAILWNSMCIRADCKHKPKPLVSNTKGRNSP